MNEQTNTTPNASAGKDSVKSTIDEHSDCPYHHDCGNCPLKAHCDQNDQKK